MLPRRLRHQRTRCRSGCATGMDTLRATDPELAAEVVRRAASLDRASTAGAFPAIMHTGILGTSREDQERFEEFANDARLPGARSRNRPLRRLRLAPHDLPRVRSAGAGGMTAMRWAAANSASSAPARRKSPPAKCPCLTTSKPNCWPRSWPMIAKPWWRSPCCAKPPAPRTINWRLESRCQHAPAGSKSRPAPSKHNFRFLALFAPRSEAELLAIVKADAYGHSLAALRAGGRPRRSALAGRDQRGRRRSRARRLP